MGLLGDIFNAIDVSRVQKNNIISQGIVNYKPSQIEAFFDTNKPIENMVFSGGAENLRFRALSMAIDIAMNKNVVPVILHCNNRELERNMWNSFGDKVGFVNPNCPFYDPFIGKDRRELSRIVFDSATRNYRLRAEAKYYIEGVFEYLQSRNALPCLEMFFTCPHSDLLNKIGEAEKKNMLSTELAGKITSLLIQGKSQIPDIENFFSALEHQGKNIFANTNNVSSHRVVNIDLAARYNKALMIDVLMDSNDVLINVIMNEVEYLVSKGRKILLILDGISPNSSDVLKKYFNRNDSLCRIIISGDDVFSLFSGEERAFFSFLGKCSKVVISNHSSAYSCDKWSDYLGTYEKQDISFSSSSSTGGWGTSTSYRAKRERVVKPEEIRNMGAMDVYIKDKYSGELAFTNVV